MISKLWRKPIYNGFTLNVKRYFDLHQYQSKDLMRKFGVLVQNGKIATTPDEALKVAKELKPKEEYIVKAQIHAGGRGKGHFTNGLKGGVQIVKTPDQVKHFTERMIGQNLITHQTTKQGLKVNAVLIHEGVDITKSLYFAFILDRNSQRQAIIASKQGGVEIEQVAKKNPEAVKVYPIELNEGITEKLLQKLQKDLELSKYQGWKDQVRNLYKLFNECDAVQVQINPWAVNRHDNKIYSVDAKINIDDNAKFRQTQLANLRKTSLASQQVDPHEDKALAAGLNYVALDGNIGCLVNGAGLAMATMDIIKLKGGQPANFLDVGGGANVQQVKTAFEILSSHPKVKSILINIFGGIMKCNTIAEGIIKAAQLVDLKIPLVCRLTGTNADLGNKMLKEYCEKNKKIKIQVADTLDEAAVKAVATISKK